MVLHVRSEDSIALRMPAHHRISASQPGALITLTSSPIVRDMAVAVFAIVQSATAGHFQYQHYKFRVSQLRGGFKPDWENGGKIHTLGLLTAKGCRIRPRHFDSTGSEVLASYDEPTEMRGWYIVTDRNQSIDLDPSVFGEIVDVLAFLRVRRADRRDWMVRVDANKPECLCDHFLIGLCAFNGC